MAKEIELKLALQPCFVETLKAHPLLACNAQAQPAQQLANQYFDTPDGALSAHAVALRIRTVGGRHIQTLKTRGTSANGLHQRGEWEWDLAQPVLDMSLLQQAQWPEELNTAQLSSQLVPLFSTDFVRQLWLLEGTTASGETYVIEVALDKGEIVSELHGDRKTDAICELELELKAGPPECLLEVALELAQQIPLLPSDISKAERGYRLLAPQSYQPEIPVLDLTAVQTLEAGYRALLMHLHGQWPRWLEAWQHDGNWDYISNALNALRDLQAVQETYIETFPVAQNSRLEANIQKLIRQLVEITAWRRVARLRGLRDWPAQNAHASERVLVLLQTCLPGSVMLEMGHRLMTSGWRELQNREQHARAAQAFDADL